VITGLASPCNPRLTAPGPVPQAYAFYTEDVRRVLLLHTERRDPPMEANVRTSFKASPEQPASPAWRAAAICLVSLHLQLSPGSALAGIQCISLQNAQGSA